MQHATVAMQRASVSTRNTNRATCNLRHTMVAVCAEPPQLWPTQARSPTRRPPLPCLCSAQQRTAKRALRWSQRRRAQRLIGVGTAPSLHTASMCQWRAHRPHPLGACDATSLILVPICPCSASGRVSLDPCALAPIDLSDAAWADPDGLEAAMAAVTGALHGDRTAVRRDQ